MKTRTNCPDCGVEPGQPHINECDVELCSSCGLQRITCDCQGHVPLKSVWTGEWPKPKSELGEEQFFVNYTSIHVGCGQYDPVTQLQLADENTPNDEIMSFQEAAEHLLSERWDELDDLNEERRVVLADIRALKEAATFKHYEELRQMYSGSGYSMTDLEV
ncbi:hypothetical protein SV7mr_19930 [Stieleria bergensis]|uniref:Uncharacterized protein n=2 Tax=Stieleria bergensis TaxID=2528025 RepID=A0A517STP2_9BACT|nr:hypothetical protein SV7mr_19930 [Planctomycetes bacterium SV_7m_r]